MAIDTSRMSAANRTWILKFEADTSALKSEMAEVKQQTSRIGDSMRTMGRVVTTALASAAVIKFTKDAVQAASEQQQAIKEAGATYGEYTDFVVSQSKKAATGLGVSKTEWLNLASTLTNSFEGAGVPLLNATKYTNDLSQAAADLAATYGGTTVDAIGAVNDAIKGNYKEIGKFHVNLDKATVEAKAMAMGYVDAEGKVTEAGKAIATQALIMEDATKVSGAFKDSGKSLETQQQVLAAQYKDMQAALGEKLLPIIVELMKVVEPFLTFIADNSGWLVPLAGVIAGIAAATKLWAVAQGILNAVMLVNPIFLIIAAIAAFIALLVVAYQKVDWFRAAVDAMADAVVKAGEWIWEKLKWIFDWIKSHWVETILLMTGPFGWAMLVIWKNWDSIVQFFRNIPGWIATAFSTLFNILTDPWVRAAGAVVTAWNATIDFFWKIPGYINQAFKGLFDILTWPFVQAAKAIAAAFMGLLDWFYRLPGVIQGYLANVGDIIIWPFKKAWGWIDQTFGGIIDWFYRLPGRIQGFFSQLADIILWPFRKAFEGIQWLWNHTLGGFGFTVPSWIPFGIGGKEFRIPKMATGGVVNRPTLALIGEAGPEAVVPLNANGSIPGVNATESVTINVYALTANAEVGRKVYEAIAEYERVSGRKFLTA